MHEAEHTFYKQTKHNAEAISHLDEGGRSPILHLVANLAQSAKLQVFSDVIEALEKL